MDLNNSSFHKHNSDTNLLSLERVKSSKSISRKPNVAKLVQNKNNKTLHIRNSDRMTFISPSKANLFISEDSLNNSNSLEFNYTKYSSKEPNYPFIKKCITP